MVVLNREGMLAAEKAAINAYTTEEKLMENAGTAAAKCLFENQDLKGKKVLVVCGKGNNGGDGFVIARALSKAAKVTVLLTRSAENYSGNPQKMLKKLPRAVNIINAEKDFLSAEKEIFKSDILVDAIFGIGFKGEAKGIEKALIDLINRSFATVYSVDVPSGIASDEGAVSPSAVRADYTITFEALKPCHILPPANALCGRILVEKIGITRDILENIDPVCRVIEKPVLPKRDKNSHKGTFGSVVNISGSFGMPGASVLSTRAALRSGVGKVYTVCHPENYQILATSAPEAVLILADIEKDTAPIFDSLKNANAILLGPGLSVSEKKQKFVKELLLSATLPIVLDADGINAIADDIEFIKKVKAELILTPHLGEMSRLTGLSVEEIEQNRIKVAKNFAKEYGVLLCLKGANTIVTTKEGEVFVNMTGNSGLSSAGSGDVLAGMIASFIAQGMEPVSALTAAVYFHGASADFAVEALSERGLIASDIVEFLPYLF